MSTASNNNANVPSANGSEDIKAIHIGDAKLRQKEFGLPEAEISMVVNFDHMAQDYPLKGSPGITHQSELKIVDYFGESVIGLISTSIMRDGNGDIIAVLRHFPAGLRFQSKEATKAPGEFSIYVRPTSRRRGVGLELLAAANELWSIDFWCQEYTKEGRELVLKYLASKSA